MDYERLAGAVRSRRLEMYLTREKLAAMSGLSCSTIKNLEVCRPGGYNIQTRLRIERALGWTVGSFDALLRGEEPTRNVPDGHPEETCPTCRAFRVHLSQHGMPHAG